MKLSCGEITFNVINTILMILLIIITVYPILYIVFASVSDPYLLTKYNGILFGPLGKPTLKGYEITFRNPNIVNGYKNTVLYVGVGTAINLFLTSMAAYVLSRKDFFIKKAMMVMIVITMFFSGGLIPLFFVVRTLKMYDTFWAVIIPTAINSWNMIVMRTFFLSVPDSMEESAAMDGANDFIIFSRIIIPLSKPVIAVMLLYYGVAHWNSWLYAMMFLRDRKLYPLQLFIREILIQDINNGIVETSRDLIDESVYRELIKYCTILVSTVPVLCLYPFLQKYFVKGVMIGALKG